MKKAFKVITLLMLVILVVTAFTMPASAKQVFADLSPEHWCYAKIMDFEKKGYVCGYSDNTFRADRTITRAEYVKIVNNFFGYKPSEKTTSAFKDVNSGDWFMPYVNEAVDRGYIEGFEDGTFRPQDPIRRQEATVILARILKIDKEVYPADHKDGLAQYSDSDEVQEWARVAIHSYSVYNFINGYEDGTLRILRNVTRAETVELLHILEQKVVIDRKPGGGGTKTPTLKPDIDVLVRNLIEVPVENEIAIKEEYTPVIYTKSNWINKKNSNFEKETARNGAFVNITSQTRGSTIHDTVDVISRKEEYKTTKRNEYDNKFFLTDGVYTVTAQATKSGRKDSGIETKVVKIDTVAPVVRVVETSSAKGKIAHEQSVAVAIKDSNLYNANEISGLDKVAYAWFNADNDERVTVWSAFELVNGQAQINAPLTYGKYKLGIAAIDVAENAFGTRTEYAVKSEDISGDVPTTPSGDVDYDFVKETESGDENPGGEEIIVIVGNNNPTIEDLTMYTTVNELVSGELKGKDIDSGDILSYVINVAPEYGTAEVNGNYTTYVSDKAGTYKYTVKVRDNHSGEAIGNVTVYVFDAKLETPSGDAENPINYDVLANGLILYVGEEKDLNASIIPSGEAEYEWSKSADEIEIKGTNKNVATIKGLVPGKTEMTVKASINGVEIEKKISVTVKGRKLTIHYVYAENGTKAHEDHIIDGVGRDGYNVVSPKIKGYTPDREVVSGGMLTSDKEETVRYTRDTAKYTVVYYTETLTSGEYKLKESEEKSSTTGSTVTIDTSKEFEGFTFDSNNTNNVLSGDVLDDGTLTLKAYYKRNEYTLNLISGDNIAEVIGAGKYKYGTKVTINATMKNEPGYTYAFECWKSGDEVYLKSQSPEVEIKGNMTLTAMAKRRANSEKYIIEYYTETFTSGEYKLKESGEIRSTTGSTVTINTSKEFEGFTFDSNNTNNRLSGDVLAGGKLTLRAYYKRNEYTLTLIAGGNVKEVTDGSTTGKNIKLTVKYGKEVNIGATLEEKTVGYDVEFDKWDSTPSGKDIKDKNATITMPNSDLTLKAVATKKEKALKVGINIESDYPKNGKQAEPGDTIRYEATVENKESGDIKVKIEINPFGEIDSIIVCDEYGNETGVTYDNLNETITIPAGCSVKINYKSKVPNDYPVAEKDFTSTVIVTPEIGTKKIIKTKPNAIEKSVGVFDATHKDKNVILILDLSGSMNDKTKDGKTSKIKALRKATQQFTDKLYNSSKETDTKVTLNVIGIGEAHDEFLGYTSPSKKGDIWTGFAPMLFNERYDSCDAYLIDSYINTNAKTWISSKFIQNDLIAYGGTNVVGALEIANGIMSRKYDSDDGVNNFISDADNYVVILTDGANGPKANKPISNDKYGLEYSKILRNSGAGIYAIYFECKEENDQDKKINIAGKADLNTILDGKYPLYEAGSADSLNMAFDSIASSINKTQSKGGEITATLPSGDKYLIIVTCKENNEEKTLITVNEISDLEKYGMEIRGNKLIWNISGTKYSACEDLKLKVTLDNTATDGKSTEGASKLLSIESEETTVIAPVVDEKEDITSGDVGTSKENKTTVSGDTEIPNNDEAKSSETVSGEDKVSDNKDGELDNKENEQQSEEKKQEENVDGKEENQEVDNENQVNEVEGKQDEKVGDQKEDQKESEKETKEKPKLEEDNNEEDNDEEKKSQ